MAGFDSIKKYKDIVKQNGITSQQNASDAAKNIVDKENATQASIWSSANLSSLLKESVSSSSTTDYAAATDAAIKKATKAATTTALLTGLAQVAGNFFANNQTSNMLGTNNAKANNAVAAVGDFAAAKTPEVKTVKLENDLADKVDNFNKKGSTKNREKLSAELQEAKNDKANLAALVADQEGIVSAQQIEQDKINGEITKLTPTKNEQQKAVDNIKQSLVDAAEAEITKLDEDDKAQDTTIKDSQKKVSDAKAECTTTVNEQKGIIANNKAMASATAKPITDPTTGAITGWNPSQQQINTAKKAIADAEAAINAAEQKRDDIIKAEETGDESVQGKAKAKKAENAESRATQQAQVQNPKSEELTAAKEALCKTTEQIEQHQASLDKTIKPAIDEATAKANKAKQQMVTISETIAQAEAALAQKAE